VPRRLADARKLAAIPSVTTYLQVLDKPALNTWKVEQGVHAVMTSRARKVRTRDAFIHRSSRSSASTSRNPKSPEIKARRFMRRWKLS